MSSASIHALTNDSMDQLFGSIASPFLQRVIPLVKSLSLTKRPLDGRFSGGHLSTQRSHDLLYDQHCFLYSFDTEGENDCLLSQLDKNITSQHTCDEIPMETDELTDYYSFSPCSYCLVTKPSKGAISYDMKNQIQTRGLVPVG